MHACIYTHRGTEFSKRQQIFKKTSPICYSEEWDMEFQEGHDLSDWEIYHPLLFPCDALSCNSLTFAPTVETLKRVLLICVLLFWKEVVVMCVLFLSFKNDCFEIHVNYLLYEYITLPVWKYKLFILSFLYFVFLQHKLVSPSISSALTLLHWYLGSHERYIHLWWFSISFSSS